MKQSRLSRPKLGSLMLRTSEIGWEGDIAEGFRYKTLFEDSENDQTTLLMKVGAGAEAKLHAHDKLEQVLLLEGQFYDQEHEYEAGDFIIRAAGAMHTGGSRTGALVLPVYTK